jgi:hypothetical protein
MPGMDTTPEDTDPIERVSQLLAQVGELDPAEAIAPLTEVADILETLLDAEDGL